MIRYIKSGRSKMRIEGSTENKQGGIDSGRGVVADVNKCRIDEDDNNGNGDRNKGGGDAVDALRINNAAVRESQIRRLGGLRANRGENEVREALECLKRSAALYEDDYNNNNNNEINNSNNGKNGNGYVGGRRREEIKTIWVYHLHYLLRLSVEATGCRMHDGGDIIRAG